MKSNIDRKIMLYESVCVCKQESVCSQEKNAIIES